MLSTEVVVSVSERNKQSHKSASGRHHAHWYLSDNRDGKSVTIDFSIVMLAAKLYCKAVVIKPLHTAGLRETMKVNKNTHHNHTRIWWAKSTLNLSSWKVEYLENSYDHNKREVKRMLHINGPERIYRHGWNADEEDADVSVPPASWVLFRIDQQLIICDHMLYV